jgi:hypothetical protein
MLTYGCDRNVTIKPECLACELVKDLRDKTDKMPLLAAADKRQCGCRCVSFTPHHTIVIFIFIPKETKENEMSSSSSDERTKDETFLFIHAAIKQAAAFVVDAF